MKARKMAITFGGIMAGMILASALWTLFRPAGPSREAVRDYFESVPEKLRWGIHSHSDWDRGLRDVYNELPINERILTYLRCAFTGFPKDVHGYAFKTQSDYVDASVMFKGNSVVQIKIYGGWIPNPDTYVLQEDLRREFPDLEVDVMPWSK